MNENVILHKVGGWFIISTCWNVMCWIREAKCIKDNLLTSYDSNMLSNAFKQFFKNILHLIALWMQGVFTQCGTLGCKKSETN